MTHVATVTIDHTKVPSDQTDYRVGIDLSHLPTTFWNTVANSGGDIRVFKDDGTTELAREVVSCDTATHTGKIYVKYTGTLSSTTDTVIRIYADGISSDYAPSATYGAQNANSAYIGVWHGKDATSTTLADSSSSALTATKTGVSDPAQYTSGKFGIAQSHTGDDGTNSRASTASTATSNLQNDFTLFALIYINSANYGRSSTQYELGIMGKGNGGNDRTWELVIRGRADAPNVGKVMYSYEVGTTHPIIYSTGTVSLGAWHIVGITFKKSTNSYKFYIDGALSGSGTLNITGDTSTSPIALGGLWETSSIYTQDWQGYLQEWHIAETELSGDTMTTIYNNLFSPSTFYTVSDVAVPRRIFMIT